MDQRDDLAGGSWDSQYSHCLQRVLMSYARAKTPRGCSDNSICAADKETQTEAFADLNVSRNSIVISNYIQGEIEDDDLL